MKRYNSVILDKLFGNIKKNKDEQWEKELFIELLKSNPNIDLFFLRNFLKLKLEKSEKQIANARDTIEKILPFLDEEMQNQVKSKYKEYDDYAK